MMTLDNIAAPMPSTGRNLYRVYHALRIDQAGDVVTCCAASGRGTVLLTEAARPADLRLPAWLCGAVGCDRMFSEDLRRLTRQQPTTASNR